MNWGMWVDSIKRIGWILPSFVMMASFLLIIACSRSPDLDEPPEIVYGVDPCDRCLMIINEARFAAAYITDSGDTRRFDDIGGMVAYKNEVSDDVAVFWVHDFETESWLKAEDAFYVESEQQTPMGFGLVAFGDRQKAEKWSGEQGGTMLTFEDLFD